MCGAFVPRPLGWYWLPPTGTGWPPAYEGSNSGSSGVWKGCCCTTGGAGSGSVGPGTGPGPGLEPGCCALAHCQWVQGGIKNSMLAPQGANILYLYGVYDEPSFCWHLHSQTAILWHLCPLQLSLPSVVVVICQWQLPLTMQATGGHACNPPPSQCVLQTYRLHLAVAPSLILPTVTTHFKYITLPPILLDNICFSWNWSERIAESWCYSLHLWAQLGIKIGLWINNFHFFCL